ncbi:MAG: hypothetical protein IT344_08610 [Candidatus Dadabacteria bacterium]|nr:hypothetical protein [Candidatus Dadabacteria bacterium]
MTDARQRTRDVKYEVARDLVALGGLPFYFLVAARAAIGPYPAFLSQVAIALPVLIVLARLVRGSNLHIARALMLVVFTSIFYKSPQFTIFAALVWAGMIFSLAGLKVPAGEIIRGIAIGAASAAVGYFLTLLVVPG